MEKEKSWETITKKGKKIKKIWQKYADKYNLRIKHNGIPALAGFSFQSKDALKYKTYLTQEMLKKGFLATTLCYSCTEHSDFELGLYENNIDAIFSKIAKFEDGEDINSMLDGQVCHSGFKRLN